MMEAQKAYLANVQATYRYYCYHVHNSGRIGQEKLAWVPSKFHTFLCDRIQEFIERPTDKAFEILLISTPPQHGKLLADSTPVLTRKGWKTHGDLTVGDEVVGINGDWVKVTHVHPKDVASLEVVITNGERIKCHPNHEWVVYDRNSHKERILETHEIKKRIECARETFQLPKKEFLKGDEKEFIESILPCEPEQGNCITVEGGVYLVGKRMIPTHNSTTVTETLGAWFLSKNPTKSVIEISYGDDLAQKFGKANMEKVRNFGNIFGVGLSRKKATPKEFELNNNKGRMISRGLDSPITGYSGDLVIIDDPIKNRAEADSEKRRDIIWEEFYSTVTSRTQAGSKVIVIMTRWHEDDLVGRIEKNMPEHCEVLNLPCEAEENDILGREIGEALCPEIGKGNEWLKDFKKAHSSEEGTRSWNALYQGRPTAREGNMLKREWWQYYKYEDYINGKIKIDNYIMSVDAAFKDSKKNDFVAVGIFGKCGNRIFMLHMSNKHLDFPSTIREIKVLLAKFPDVSAILIEDKANGSGIIQTLRNEIMGIIPVEPYGSKESRVADVSYMIEAGNVYLPKDLSFTWDFVDQCSSFPNGKHDDMVDSMSQALERLARFKNFKRDIRKQQLGERFFSPRKKKTMGRGDKINVI